MINKLFFVRHGESEANAQGVFAPDKGAGPEVQLTDTGREQARQAGAEAKEIGITHIISSDQDRTMETARLIALVLGLSEPNITPEPRLRELGVGNLAGQPVGPSGLPIWLQHQAEPQGDTTVEPLIAVRTRLQDFIVSLRDYDQESVLIVGHSGSGTILYGMMTGDTSELAEQPRLPNGRIIEFPSPSEILS
jgi:broad specificity phosphatase PhoE